MTTREQLQQSIVALEGQRAILGDVVVDTMIAAAREKLAAMDLSPTTEQQRKQVTVLFGDVSGFTNMSERLDAEEVNDIMNTLWQHLDAVITEHGGIVDKHMGDGVMALWGAEIAREDDPERAIHAALTMQQILNNWQKNFRQKSILPLNQISMRIGVNTGPVLLSEIATTGEFTAIGDAVNTASRLEQAAPIGGILISHDTYRHVKGVFDVETLPPIQFKGKSVSLKVYLVQQAKPRAFHIGLRQVEGIETRMIGRAEELATLQQASKKAIEEKKGQIITIIGEAGLGKSRLLYEFENWQELLPHKIRIFKGRAWQEMRHLPFALIRDVFSFRFQIHDNDTPAVARQKMEAGFTQYLGPAGVEKAHFVGHLLGLDFSNSPYVQVAGHNARQIREQAFHYMFQFFEATTQTFPSSIVLEDIHWGDDGSLDFITYLAARCSRFSLFIVCLTRPSLFEHQPRWGESWVGYEQLRLTPLSKEDSHHLVTEILQHMPHIPPLLEATIVNNSEGNPFYMEELVKMMVEDGVIVKIEDTWQVGLNQLAKVKVPPTLTGVLQARLDRLSPAERDILQRASVIGRIFWDKTITYLIDREGHESKSQADIHAILAKLQTKELLFRREISSFAACEEYIFKHAILYEVTYEQVLKAQRRPYHHWAAQWLIEQSGERASEHAGLIADHFEHAGDFDQAQFYLGRAGEQAFRQSAFEQALTFFQRAYQLSTIDVLTQLTLGIRVSECLFQLGNNEQAHHYLETSLKTARQHQYTKQIAEALHYLGLINDRQGHYEESKSYLEESLTLARQVDDQPGIARTLNGLATVYSAMGDFTQARANLQKSLVAYRLLDDKHGIADALNGLGVIAIYDMNYAQGTKYHNESLTLCRQVGYSFGVARSLNNLGYLAMQAEDYAAAEIHLQEALSISREIGSLYIQVVNLHTLGEATTAMGEIKKAQAYYYQSLQTAQSFDNPPLILANLAGLAGLEAQQDNLTPALEILGFVLQHPATLDETKMTIELLSAELKTKYPPETITTGLAHCTTGNLESVTQKVMVQYQQTVKQEE